MYPNSVEKRSKTIMNCFRDRSGSHKDLRDAQHYNDSSTKFPLSLSKSQSRIHLSQCDGSCVQKIQELLARVSLLERKYAGEKLYSKGLESRIFELSKKLETFKQPPISITKATTHEVSASVKTHSTIKKLTSWCNNRPTIETLKRNNIFYDEPCFDTELEQTLKHEVYKTIPKIVVDCVDLIESQFKKSPHPIEGLYRVSGDYTKIQALRYSIDSNDYESLKTVTNIHTLTGVLKLFLREIKSPLVKPNEIKTFIGPTNLWLLQPITKKIEILQNLVRTLPECNRDTLNYLFSHFHRLTKVPLQNASSEVLANTITPSILQSVAKVSHPHDLINVMKDTVGYVDCLQLMIDHSSKIFGCKIGEKRRFGKQGSFKRSLSQPCLVVSKVFSSV